MLSIFSETVGMEWVEIGLFYELVISTRYNLYSNAEMVSLISDALVKVLSEQSAKPLFKK